jgi:hypothetical protein
VTTARGRHYGRPGPELRLSPEGPSPLPHRIPAACLPSVLYPARGHLAQGLRQHTPPFVFIALRGSRASRSAAPAVTMTDPEGVLAQPAWQTSALLRGLFLARMGHFNSPRGELANLTARTDSELCYSLTSFHTNSRV